MRGKTRGTTFLGIEECETATANLLLRRACWREYDQASTAFMPQILAETKLMPCSNKATRISIFMVGFHFSLQTPTLDCSQYLQP